MTVADSLFIDTNVLLTAIDPGRDGYTVARSLFRRSRLRTRSPYVSPQVLREYLVVATRPMSANGLGMSMADALKNLRALRDRTSFLVEDRRVAERFAALIADVQCTGKQIHDANIVATMLVHGIGRLVTDNGDDFRRFESHVSILSLSATTDP